MEDGERAWKMCGGKKSGGCTAGWYFRRWFVLVMAAGQRRPVLTLIHLMKLGMNFICILFSYCEERAEKKKTFPRCGWL